MQSKTVTLICLLIIGNVMASQDEPASGVIEKPRGETPQGPIASQGGWQPFGFFMSKLKYMFSKGQPSSAQEPIASQEDEPASGVIVQKSKLPKQEQPGSALEGPGGNVLLKNVDEIASMEKGVKEVGENEELLKAIQAVEKNIRKNVFNKDIGTDSNIFEAIMAAKGKSPSFLFEIASPKVLTELTKQKKRPKVKEWAEGTTNVYEKLERLCGFVDDSISEDDYNEIMKLIGGITTLGVEFTRNKFLTDGVYASVLGGEGLNDMCFQLLLDSATPTAIRLALNSEWLTHRFDPQDNNLTQAAKSRHSDLEEAYRQHAEANIARQLGITPGKDERYSVVEPSKHIASFLLHQPIENDIITEPSGRIDLSILGPFKVHLKDGIPKKIIELAVGQGQAEGSKLDNEQVKQIRPYGPALVTYIFEHELDIEQFLEHTGLYSDYETFVAFMDVYGPNIRIAYAWNKYSRVFRMFKGTLGGRYMVRALFSVRNFYAALSLYHAIPLVKSFVVEMLRFLAKVTRFPLDAFSILRGGDGGLFEMRALAIRARRIKNIREAAEKGNLKYLRKHLLDGNVTEHGLVSILELGSAIPMEAFELILSVIGHGPESFAHMTLEQRDLAENHDALYYQLDEACWRSNLMSIGTLLANPNCTPGMRIGMFLGDPRYGVLVEGLLPVHCELIVANWMNCRAPRSAELDAVLNRCLQYYTAKHE